MTYLSAAKLLKNSCRQTRHLLKTGTSSNPSNFFESKPATERQLSGNAFAESVRESQYVEMGNGIFHSPKGRPRLSFFLYFSIDEVRVEKNKLIAVEVKGYGEDEWYFQNALLQTAFNAAMARRVENLRTAKFLTDRGAPRMYLKIDRKVESMLIFGDQKYSVKCSDDALLLRFFFTKARAAISDWDTASRFDNTYKHKEWLFLGPLIKSRKLK